MRRIALIIAAAAALLATAGTAQAKEVQSLKVCGSSGCNEVTDREALRSWTMDYGSRRPAPAGAFYTVVVGFGDGQSDEIMHREHAYWLPGSGLMQLMGEGNAGFFQLAPAQASFLRSTVSGLEPFVPRLSRVRVNGRTVANPDYYLTLFGNYRYALVPQTRLTWARIVLRAAEPNPWVNGTVYLRYSAKRRLLERPDGLFRLPKAVGRQLVRRAALSVRGPKAAAPRPSRAAGDHTALYAGVGVAGVAALAVALGIGRAVRRKGTNS